MVEAIRQALSAGGTDDNDRATSLLDFTDADLKATLRRAMRLRPLPHLALSSLLSHRAGRLRRFCSPGRLFRPPDSTSGSSYWADQRSARQSADARSTGLVLTMFFLRLGFAALVIYVSLRCFHGSPYALIAGLGSLRCPD